MRNEIIYYVYNSIELNIQRMIIYKNIGIDNIREKRKKKNEKRLNTFGDVCWFLVLLTRRIKRHIQSSLY
jgi:hypothetical protein